MSFNLKNYCGFDDLKKILSDMGMKPYPHLIELIYDNKIKYELDWSSKKLERIEDTMTMKRLIAWEVRVIRDGPLCDVMTIYPDFDNTNIDVDLAVIMYRHLSCGIYNYKVMDTNLGLLRFPRDNYKINPFNIDVKGCNPETIKLINILILIMCDKTNLEKHNERVFNTLHTTGPNPEDDDYEIYGGDEGGLSESDYDEGPTDDEDEDGFRIEQMYAEYIPVHARINNE